MNDSVKYRHWKEKKVMGNKGKKEMEKEGQKKKILINKNRWKAERNNRQTGESYKVRKDERQRNKIRENKQEKNDSRFLEKTRRQNSLTPPMPIFKQQFS